MDIQWTMLKQQVSLLQQYILQLLSWWQQEGCANVKERVLPDHSTTSFTAGG
jgi:hypothetical protein